MVGLVDGRILIKQLQRGSNEGLYNDRGQSRMGGARGQLVMPREALSRASAAPMTLRRPCLHLGEPGARPPNRWSASDPLLTSAGLNFRSAAVSRGAEVCYPFGLKAWEAQA